MNFIQNNILSINQFDSNSLTKLFATADKMQAYVHRQKRTTVLDGAILGNLFLEASTRTRLSFGSAFNLLGGSVRETTNVIETSFTKGESLADSAKVLSCFSDIICIRHPASYSAQTFANSSDVPVINGGDGSNEHPTQALLDLYTILKELNKANANNLKIAVVGDLKYGRTVHSLCKLLAFYDNIDLHLVPFANLKLPSIYLDELTNSGMNIYHHQSLESALSKSDIIYTTRVQKERFENAEATSNSLQLNRQLLKANGSSNTVIMHPLPRDGYKEIDEDLNNSANLAIFRQVSNGVTIRMALFALILDVADKVQDYEQPITWNNNC